MSQPVAVILGAGIGGSAVATKLATTCHVVVVDRDPALAQGVATTVERAGGSAEWASVDLLDLPAITAFRDDLLARLGRVDAVIHLVGGWQGSPTVDAAALSAWDAIAPGVFGTVQSTSVAFRETLMAAPAGCYAMVSSTATAKPTAGNAAYATAKAAAETWVRALADSFKDSPARAVIVAVKALVSQAQREQNPDKAYPGYTDTGDLAAAIAGILRDATTANGARIDLTEGR